MKKAISILCSLFVAAVVYAQSDVSAPMDFHIEKELVPPVLNVVPNTLRFIDPSNNNAIDGGETCKIRFEVENSGRGDAYGCTVHIVATGTKEGLIIKDFALPVIPSGKRHQIEIPIEATARTQTGKVDLIFSVNEPNGYGTDDIHYSIGTHRLRTPFVEVASYAVGGSKDGKLHPKEPFSLQIIVQNTDQGVAENVSVGLQLPPNVNWEDGSPEHFSMLSLQPNEKCTLKYELRSNKLVEDHINIHLDIKEKTGLYAKNADIPLTFGQYVGKTIAMNIERHDEEVEILKASLIADVDENIPTTNKKNDKTFVLIITNEEYMIDEIPSVQFANHDGAIFHQYCEQVLGIPSSNITELKNATNGQIKREIRILSDLINEFKDKRPEVIFYYSGHGVPDESDKTSYILPVDGTASDMSTCYKLDDLYNALGHMPAVNVTVFIDACFSGSVRGTGTIWANAKGVARKAVPGQPQGNTVVFSAAQGDETAYPYLDKQHGMFTYFLLKKLKDTKGDVSLQELNDYISENVRQQSLLINRKRQSPCMTPSASLQDGWQNRKLK